MTLIKSISGIRGTIGGKEGTNLSPLDIVKFTAAFAKHIQITTGKERLKVVVGRDARISGEMVSGLVVSTLVGMGSDVVDLGLTTTPTVEMAVPEEKASAGIIITASHNPTQWNALKLLNGKGEFISVSDGENVLTLADQMDFEFAPVEALGSIQSKDYLKFHIEKILALSLVNSDAIRSANFSVAIDAVNSTGGIYIPELLRALGVNDVHCLHCTPNGRFPHNPEPLPAHLTDISDHVRTNKLNLGIVVDPDVDRLALVCEDGSMFGEEYTLVAVADYILKHTPGNTVSNLSSTRALRVITEKRGLKYEAAAVGEVNVVVKMKEINAVIGGEGNGGIIYPELHYGRDALAGIALFLSALAETGKKCTEYRNSFPQYVISKNKIELPDGCDVDAILAKMINRFPDAKVNTIDGVKFDFAESWAHLRKSNTEPIIRIYTESANAKEADQLAANMLREINGLIGQPAHS